MSDDTITVLVVDPARPYGEVRQVEPTLDEFQRLVGGYLQAVSLTHDSVMYLNEDGKYAGLPVNGVANRLTVVGEVGLMADDFIVGTVVVTGVLDAHGHMDGKDHDVPASVLALCERAGVPTRTAP